MDDKPDAKAVEILFRKYWTGARWTRAEERKISAEDYNYAVDRDVMFPPAVFEHDETIDRVLKSIRTVRKETVAAAFVRGLEINRPDYWSALGTFAIGNQLPRHEYQFVKRIRPRCGICGTIRKDKSPRDRSVQNFERLKWGGVRHESPDYIAFDLNQFSKLSPPPISDVNYEPLSTLFRCLEAAEPRATPGSLRPKLASELGIDKKQAETILCILSYCGVLTPKDMPTFFDSQIPYRLRMLPGHRATIMKYPIAWWRPRDGINYQAVGYWFPGFIRK